MEPGGHDAIMAFRVIFIFMRIGADEMGYEMPYHEDCRTCPCWGDWNGECDYFGYCPTRERMMRDEEESEGD